MIIALAAALSGLVIQDVAYRIPLRGPGGYESYLVDLEFEPNREKSISIHFMAGHRRVAWQQAPSVAEMDPKGEGRARIALHQPASLGVDRVIITDGETSDAVTIKTYEQKNSYIFPLAGNGLITQGPFNNGGHSARSTLFANDVIGLDTNYAPMLGEEETNENMAGFGMDVIAPADGTIVWTRTGIPDQVGGYDENSFKLPDGTSAFTGNAVVIDHGNGEFVTLMHMKKGSIVVKVGDKVVKGQKLGQLGNSGDSFGAHLHIQLQDGPIPGEANGLPIKFSDQGDRYLTRGQYISHGE